MLLPAGQLLLAVLPLRFLEDAEGALLAPCSDGIFDIRLQRYHNGESAARVKTLAAPGVDRSNGRERTSLRCSIRNENDRIRERRLLFDSNNDAGTDGTAAFTDGEAEVVLNRDRGDQLDLHVDVVARHAHLDTFGKGDDAGDVRRTEVELGTIVVKEGGMTAAFFLGQDVDTDP